MYSGDEFYGDDVTSGPATDDPRLTYRDTWTVIPCEQCGEPATRARMDGERTVPLCDEHAP